MKKNCKITIITTDIQFCNTTSLDNELQNNLEENENNDENLKNEEEVHQKELEDGEIIQLKDNNENNHNDVYGAREFVIQAHAEERCRRGHATEVQMA